MKKSNYMWSHTSYVKFDLNGNEVKVENAEFINKVFPVCLAYNPIATPTVVIKKSILNDKSIRFAEDITFGEDGYLWSILSKKFPVGHLNEFLTHVRITNTNANSRVSSHLEFRSKLYDEIKNNPKFFSVDDMFLDLKLAYRFTYKINKLNLNEGILMKVLYAIPYLIFKKYKIKQKGSFRY
ncbi:hypothetical protein EXW93_13915 [Exiguobacterium sp. JMULE1]|uniref:hypothetical protein n=1 Tax=Exiguobacterium sp. JMULE1 TaxID=2518339 RepID=UPI0015771EC0|nr:hypothetical protein [Exiguobacterium sp. JMULE1]NTY10692.1 hypothetical protein [Exiguobacterium sp. JMULE1]